MKASRKCEDCDSLCDVRASRIKTGIGECPMCRFVFIGKKPQCKSVWHVNDWGAKFTCDLSEGHQGQHRCSWRDESYPYAKGSPKVKLRSVIRVSFCWKVLKDEPIPLDHYAHPDFKPQGART